jgi:3-oxoadipate enol-lactonase
MPTAKVGDINIYYESHGDGEPLLLIMGYGSYSGHWAPLIPYLSPEYRVISFDNRGTGQSDKPDIPYTIKMMADDASGLLDAIGVDAAHVFGVSMGGMIAQEFALNYPSKLKSLILGCTHCGGTKTIHGFARQAQGIMTHDTYDRLPQIKVPTLVIAGNADRLIPADNSRILASKIPSAELVILENAGHGFVTDAAAEATRIMLDFLRRHTKGKKKT